MTATAPRLHTSRVASDLFPRAVARAALPSRFGAFRIVAFENLDDGRDHVAIVKGDVEGHEDVVTRVHSECLTGDALASLRCDCRAQLELALQTIGDRERGMVLYLRQEGRGIGLCNKIRSYELQDQGLDTVEANLALGFRDDERDYRVAAEMVECLGVRSIALMTNNPSKVGQLRHYGVNVTTRVAHETMPNEHNRHYLATKRSKSGHLLQLHDDAE